MTNEDNNREKTPDSSTEDYLDGKNDIKTYVQKRFEETKKYYKKRSKQYGRLFIVLQILVISVGTLIPVINAIYPSNNIANVLPVSSILGALIVVLSGILGLLKVQEFWLLYTSTLDELEREYELFLHGIGPYNLGDDKRKERVFISRIEDIIISKGHRYVALRGPGDRGQGEGDGGGHNDRYTEEIRKSRG